MIHCCLAPPLERGEGTSNTLTLCCVPDLCQMLHSHCLLSFHSDLLGRRDQGGTLQMRVGNWPKIPQLLGWSWHWSSDLSPGPPQHTPHPEYALLLQYTCSPCPLLFRAFFSSVPLTTPLGIGFITFAIQYPLGVSTWICLTFDLIRSLGSFLRSFADMSSIRKAIVPISE